MEDNKFKDLLSGKSISSDFDSYKKTQIRFLSEKLENKTVKINYFKNSIIGKVKWVGTNEGSESEFNFCIELIPDKKLNSKKDIEEFKDWYGEDQMIDLDDSVSIEY